MKIETLVMLGDLHDPLTGAVNPPIYLSSTFVQESPGRTKGFEYSRTANPTRSILERHFSALDSADFGLAFSSGMAAIDALLKLLQPGDHVIAGDDLYGGTFRLFSRIYTPYGIEFSYVDSSSLQAVKDAIKNNTKMIWIESPSNPLLKISDIQALSSLKKNRELLIVVDNTFATPYLQRPLELGADIVVYSTTKYISGHSDVLGGFISLKDRIIYDKLKFIQNSVGAVPSPFDCFLILRGIKTLCLRMERHSENAFKIAHLLAKRSEVERVYYPGLERHPHHHVAKKQMRLFGGMLSFKLKETSLPKIVRFLTSTRIFKLAESLGSTESLIDHPYSMTHASMPEEERVKRGITTSLIRLSVGIEHWEDLWEDLTNALVQMDIGDNS